MSETRTDEDGRWERDGRFWVLVAPSQGYLDRQALARDAEAAEVLPSDAERIAALEAQVEAATRLADQANATAQEVAQAMRDARPGKP